MAVLISCGTPMTWSLVLSGLMRREFIQHRLAMSERSLFNAVTASEIWLGGRPRKIFVPSTYPIAWQCLGTDKRSFTYSVNKTGPSIEPCGTPIDKGRWLEIQLAILTTEVPKMFTDGWVSNRNWLWKVWRMLARIPAASRICTQCLAHRGCRSNESFLLGIWTQCTIAWNGDSRLTCGNYPKKYLSRIACVSYTESTKVV